ncbi:MAG: aspartate carbamoyltransferase catalytic subunit, partial [bacterium]
MKLNHKDLIDLSGYTPDDINLILDTAETMLEISQRPIKKVPTLRGKTVVNLFFEPSTRTRTSFEIAGKRMSADVINISTSTSSVLKGENLNDTARNLEAMNADIIVVRHSCPGVPHILSQKLAASVLNAGDGAHAHPTQALLDMLTIRRKLGRLEGISVLIVGDIAHSRVARSNIAGLTKMGAKVTVSGPRTLMPLDVEELGVKVALDLEQAITGADVVMVLRIQSERQSNMFIPSFREYSKLYGIHPKRLTLAKPELLIMHPGPINRGVEMDPEVADGDFSVILAQV